MDGPVNSGKIFPMSTLEQGTLFGTDVPPAPRLSKTSARVFLNGRVDDFRRETHAYADKGGTQEDMLRQLESIIDPEIRRQIETIRTNMRKGWSALARYQNGGEMRHGADDYATHPDREDL